MKLKINDIVIPNLISVYQSFDKDTEYQANTTATFGDIDNIDKLVVDIKFAVFTEISVLNDSDNVITTFKVDSLDSIAKNVNEEVQVLLRFS